MTLKIRILGCGTSTGVPRIGNDWGACDPNNPRNRRSRCSILVTQGQGKSATRILVDTTPDLRQQLLAAGVGELDAVVFTHDHADHTHGIDDLRVVALNKGRRVETYFDSRTWQSVDKRFGYCFHTTPGGAYPPTLKSNVIEVGTPLRIAGAGGTMEILPFSQIHGDTESLGFRFGRLAYSSDLNGLSDESYALLHDLDFWIVDALRYRPHPSHFSVEEALAAIARVAPKRAILTHMHVDLDYEALKRQLPKNVEPAYDGMEIEA